jgi:UDP-glucose 4-epimerase
MRYLLTGASGYLAQAFALKLKEFGEEVVLASRTPLAGSRRVSGCKEVLIDYTDPRSIRNAVGGVDTVIHCAGLNAFESAENPDLAETVNSKNTQLIVENSIGLVDCFVYISTIHVYDSDLSGVITESTKPTNSHPYAISHLHGEEHVQRYSQNFPKGAFSIRLANTFGVPIGETSLGWNLVINDLCRQAVQNQKIVLKSNPTTIRNFIPISRATQSIYQIVNDYSTSNRISHFNLGANQNLSLGEVVSIITREYLKLFGSRIEVDYEKNTHSDKQDFSFNSNYLIFKNISFEEEVSKLLIRAYELRPRGTN